jgi:N-acetylmuramoyl-L-alanine amidase
VLYIDFGPKLSGESVRALDAPLPPQVAAVRLPAGLKPTVVIDAGHGGNDGGAQGFVGEDEVVLAIALKLRNLLESQGMDVILTRDDDVFLTLAERARFATTERNVFVSIHANSAPDRKANGIETWVFGQPLNDSQIDIAITENGGGAIGEELTRQAQEVANSIAGDILREDQLRFSLNLAEHVQEQLIGATDARDRGVRQNVFYVIKNARIPASLVEVGFVSNPEEGEKLGTAAYQEKLATALANGISNFFDSGGALARR